MAKISKCTAEEIAEKLVNPLRKQLKELRCQLGDLFVSEMNKLIPEEVKELAKIHPKYFQFSSSGYVHFLGQHKYISETKSKYISRTSKDSLIVEDQRIADQFNDLFNRVEKLDKEIKLSEKEFVQTIMSLGTTAKLKENFPEAYVFLPETKQDVVAIDISSTREKVQNIFKTMVNGK